MMRPWKLLSLAALAAALLAPAAVQSAPILRVQSVAATAGGGGSFNITLELPPGDPPIALASFTLDLSVPAGQGVQFTGVQTSEQVGQPYAFPGGSGFVATFAVPFSSDVFPNTSFMATDSSVLLPGQFEGPAPFVTGLANVSYAVDSGATLGFLPFALGPFTGLADANGNPIPFQVLTGGINVTPAGGVPEPATLLLFAVGGLALAGGRRAGRALQRPS